MILTQTDDFFSLDAAHIGEVLRHTQGWQTRIRGRTMHESRSHERAGRATQDAEICAWCEMPLAPREISDREETCAAGDPAAPVRSETALLAADVAPAAFRLSAAAEAIAAAAATAKSAAAAATTPVAAAVAAAAVAATASTGGTRAAAARPVFRRVHPERAAIELIAVELLDRFRRIFVGGVLDERETTRPAALAVVRKKHITHFTDLGEEVLHFRFRGIEIQIPYKNF